MKIGKSVKIFFSPGDHTSRIMDAVLSGIGMSVESVDLSRRNVNFEIGFSADTVCVFGVPSFGGRVPGTALERMRMMKGSNTPAVLLTSYGNREYDDTLIELKDFLSERGFIPVAAAAALAEHTICPEFAAGRPDKNDEAELADFGKKVRELLESGDKYTPVDVPGGRPYKNFGGVPYKPAAGDKCIGCGECASFCPVGAISLNDVKHCDKELCVTCMRCVWICPTGARQLPEEASTALRERLSKVCSGYKKNQFFL